MRLSSCYYYCRKQAFRRPSSEFDLASQESDRTGANRKRAGLRGDSSGSLRLDCCCGCSQKIAPELLPYMYFVCGRYSKIESLSWWCSRGGVSEVRQGTSRTTLWEAGKCGFSSAVTSLAGVAKCEEGAEIKVRTRVWKLGRVRCLYFKSFICSLHRCVWRAREREFVWARCGLRRGHNSSQTYSRSKPTWCVCSSH